MIVDSIIDVLTTFIDFPIICIRSVTVLDMNILNRSSSFGKIFLHNQNESATGSEGIESAKGLMLIFVGN